MNITLFIGSLYGGGAERVICNLANYLAIQGHSVEILTMSETKESYEISEKVSVQSLLKMEEKHTFFSSYIKRTIRLCKYMIKNKEKEAYIVMLPSTIIFFMMFRFLTKAKVIISERADPNAYSKLVQKLMKICAKKSDGFVFQTEDAKNWYRNYIMNVRTNIIPNAINASFLYQHYQEKRRKEIVAVGRLNAQKNYPMLVTAFSQIALEFPDYKLVIYGEGGEKENLQQLINSLNLKSRIILAGNVDDIADRIQEASLFVLSSKYEGMPNALMEAMALGLPCISTDCPVGGPRFLIKSGENGYLIENNNLEQLIEKMRFMLKFRDEARTMGKNAMAVRQTLNPARIYSIWEQFIVNIINE